MFTVLLIGALIVVLVVLGRESDGPQTHKVVKVVDDDEISSGPKSQMYRG